MNSPTNWKFFKQDQNKILFVHICNHDLPGIAISINKWWKSRYPEYKMRIVPKKVFDKVKIREQQSILKINLW